MPERRDTLFKGRPKSGLDFLNAPRQSGNRTKSPVHSMGYGLCVDVQKSGTTQIQNVLDKGYNLFGLPGVLTFYGIVSIVFIHLISLVYSTGQIHAFTFFNQKEDTQ